MQLTHNLYTMKSILSLVATLVLTLIYLGRSNEANAE